MKREVIYYKHYFLDFISEQPDAVRKKIAYSIVLLETLPIVTANHAKHLEGTSGIYELRSTVGSNEYRTLFFFEKGNLADGGKIVVLGNAFLKKGNKDYIKAIELAQKIRAQYFEELKSR